MSGSVDDDERDQPGHREIAGDRQQTDRADRDAANDVSRDHEVATIDAVRQDAAPQKQHDLRQAPGHSHSGERRRRVRQVVGLPGDGDDVDAVSDERDRKARPQEGEVANPKRAEDTDPVDDGGTATPQPEPIEEGRQIHSVSIRAAPDALRSPR